jgi:hypothetical protein
MKTENEENKCMSWIHSYPEWNQEKRNQKGKMAVCAHLLHKESNVPGEAD